MATLNLNRVFVTLMSSGASVSANSAPGRVDDFVVAGESRVYAGGRRRSVTGAGQVATFGFTLLLVPAASVTMLRGWAGQAVQVRDNLGRRVFGVYRAVPAAEVRGRPGKYHVAITLDVLTIDEAV
jgi:hypothetical protein